MTICQGNLWDILPATPANAAADVWEFLKSLDALIDGPFIISQKDLSLRFRGSKNQRLLHLENGTGKILSVE